MHLCLALLFRRDYFARLNASLSGSFVPQGLFYPGQMHLYLALLFRRDYFARPDASHHWKAIAKNISAKPFRQIHIFLHRIKEKIFSLLTFLPSFAFILPYSQAVIDMFKGFQVCPGLVYYIPLNIIRCQQLVDQKPMLLQQLFKPRIGKRRLNRFTACFCHHNGVLHTPFGCIKEVFIRIIKHKGAAVRTNSSEQ